MGVLTAVFCYSLVFSSSEAVDERASSVFSVNSSNTGTELNGRPFLAVGLRMSNALISHEKTQEQTIGATIASRMDYTITSTSGSIPKLSLSP